MKILQILAFSFVLTPFVWGQADPEDLVRPSPKPDIAEVRSSYELSVKINVSKFLENEDVKDMVEELRERMPNPEEFLVENFTKNLNTIVKIQLLQANATWAEITVSRQQEKEKVLLLNLNATEFEDLTKLLVDESGSLESKLTPALIEYQPMVAQIEEWKKTCEPDMQKWIGLKFKETIALAESEKVTLQLVKLDDIPLNKLMSTPTDLSDHLNENYKIITVQIHGGVVFHAEVLKREEEEDR